ncbi:MAG: molybdate ABC transporter substrate-binding protein [Candidatus Acidiferrales bacterium]
MMMPEFIFRRIGRRHLLVAGLLIGLQSLHASAREITVAAASDLQFVFPEIAARFQKETGCSVRLIFGSSGNFYSQIQNGAPFDLFFSADSGYPNSLEKAGLAEPGALRLYAVGQIVLWAPRGSSLDVNRGLVALLDPGVRKIAIANPGHAPYGRAAVAALRSEKVYDRVSGKLVLGENISQAAQFVQSGAADAAILALALVASPAMNGAGKYHVVPADDYPPLEQAAVVLKSSKQKAAARQFLEFLREPEIQSLMRDFGFLAPESRKPASSKP